MFGLFLLICSSGADICSYQSAGYIYPDYQNCTADIAAQPPLLTNARQLMLWCGLRMTYDRSIDL